MSDSPEVQIVGFINREDVIGPSRDINEFCGFQMAGDSRCRIVAIPPRKQCAVVHESNTKE